MTINTPCTEYMMYNYHTTILFEYRKKMAKTLSANLANDILFSCKDLGKAITELCDTQISVEKHFPCVVSGLKGSLTSFFIANYIERSVVNKIHDLQYNNTFDSSLEDIFIVTAGKKEAEDIQTDLETILSDSASVYVLPWWEVLPYRPSAKKSAIFGERTSILSKIVNKNYSKDSESLKKSSSADKSSPAFLKNTLPRIFIIPERAFLTPLPPPDYIKKLSITIRKGQSFDPEKISSTLADMGYTRVPRVTIKGEYALRGEVLDIFMPGNDYACRIVFDFETVEQIKAFDPELQTSTTAMDGVVIYPMKEVIWTDELAQKLEEILDREDKEGIVNNFAIYDAAKKNGNFASPSEKISGEELSHKTLNDTTSVHLSLTDEARKQKDRIITELAVNHESEGEELFYGFLWDKTYTIMDYISSKSTVFFMDYDRLVNGQKSILNEYIVSYRTARQNLPVLMPKNMLFDFKTLETYHTKNILFRNLETVETLTPDNQNETDEQNDKFYRFDSEPSQSFFGNINYFKEHLKSLQNDFWTIYIFADNENQGQRIRQVVSEFVEIQDKRLRAVQVIPNAISEGFSIADNKILVIQENEIFGRKKHATKANRKVKSKVIDTFVELTPGDYIVHVNFGIGLFKGIERVKAMGAERDYIKLEYADEEIAFVPIEQVNLVQRYIGSESEKPRLDRIGSKSWTSRKAKVQQKVEEIAEKLIDLYSKRQAAPGFAFPKDSEWQAAFEAAFPYDDTPDQFTATQDIKQDMESSSPMDRLVCGDVGYGKTEIAMRAAFKAVMGGKQVAFLAPTTILAEQHYENCLERFKNFPVQIAQMSRFVSKADQKKTLEKLAHGEVDILVGTHRIIQKDVIFKDLGLMIIDEEQRFGVKDKERLKVMKTNIDSLAMSATPIPRTLHMSLLKIRDMSLLTTAPQNRHPIETAIEEYNDEKIAQAIRREVERGGQVFYLHNRVETLEETRIKLEHLVPEMLIDTAHGKMTADELDEIFRRFKMGGFNVLVATTIIENGIDIPNVNTIIIDRADMYGVSQLYQLRGRVGRSDRKAYAYLFYPENKALSEVAMKRLEVISDFTELGSGFKIAMKDMEIRGAGNLLGKDQSGEVYAVGFEMYLNLLNNAIERLSNSGWKAPSEVLMELEYSGFIPTNYIQSPEIKMEMYKKIASIQNDEELESIYEELFDRFGPVPDEVNSLLSLAKIRIICTKLNIQSLKERMGIVHVTFEESTPVNIDKILRLIKTSSGKVTLDPVHTNQLILKTGKIELQEKSEFIKEKLEQLM